MSDARRSCVPNLQSKVRVSFYFLTLVILSLYVASVFSTSYGNWSVGSNWNIGPNWNISPSSSTTIPSANLFSISVTVNAALVLMSIVPLIIVAGLILASVRSKSFDSKELFSLIVICGLISVGCIIILQILNACSGM